MRRILNNAISLIVVVIVLFLVIPLHPSVLDVLLILNISLSIMILMITMNISEPLEFSIFPSLLLITTLFRLGLNVSSTRLILKNGGNAGVVIKAFGDLITQGNIVIGILIFLIIVLVPVSYTHLSSIQPPAARRIRTTTIMVRIKERDCSWIWVTA